MSMRTTVAACAILLASGTALSAQTSSSAPTGGRSAASPKTLATSNAQDHATSASNEPLRQQVRDNLVKAGFTDIRIMPTSFMVRAKDQSGNPVMMVINPDSFTEVTAVAPNTDQTSTQNKTNGGAGKQQ